MFRKLQRKVYYTHRQGLLTTHHQKFGEINPMVVRVISGLWDAFYTRWLHWSPLSEQMTWMVYTKESLEANTLQSANNTLVSWLKWLLGCSKLTQNKDRTVIRFYDGLKWSTNQMSFLLKWVIVALFKCPIIRIVTLGLIQADKTSIVLPAPICWRQSKSQLIWLTSQVGSLNQIIKNLEE